MIANEATYQGLKPVPFALPRETLRRLRKSDAVESLEQNCVNFIGEIEGKRFLCKQFHKLTQFECRN